MIRQIFGIFNILLMVIIFLIISAKLLHASDISVSPSSNLIQKFETLYIKIDLTYPFTNPYDPEDIRVDAIITTPNGERITLPCFYKSGPSKNSEWEARFTTMQTGLHSYHIQVNNNQNTSNSQTYQVKVKESIKDGFLRLNPHSKYSFIYDSGKRFRGIGLNLGWEFEPKWGSVSK